ncbi:hypothetical protein, variant 1 [Aphanomyces invadans]|uniref:Inositol polyphosphate-related phosphatase domain-containing protein n=1 Tax=Aphanomyces invadans TaxID=157072 RepID=A0A024UUA1_9STRA|nr:hypothetical protein, variant 1 [Aphanomyces invadans]ETW09530.1 hypothetical protein, variant 1 [Aphanomyces invadans]|eukprot:XP_008860943.1 hypothetical protein, variant 1 [Aphanomyces invadans]
MRHSLPRAPVDLTRHGPTSREPTLSHLPKRVCVFRCRFQPRPFRQCVTKPFVESSRCPLLPGQCPAYNDTTFTIASSRSVLVMCHALWLILTLVLLKMAVVAVLFRPKKTKNVAAFHHLARVLMVYLVYFVLYRAIDATILALDAFDMISPSSPAVHGALFGLHHVLSPLEGCGLAVLYGGAAACFSDQDAYLLTFHPSSSPSNHEGCGTSTLEQCRSMGHMRLFVTAYDLCKLYFPASHLPQWLPPDHDLYVVGLQNCIDVDDAKQAIVRHLQRLAPFADFQAVAITHSRRLLPSMDGASVVQLVFAKSADIALGNVVVDEMALKSSSRQVAAVALRLFDASLAVATCGLKPFSDDHSLTRKVQDAMHLMQSFDASQEFPHHCQHTILGGSFHFGVGKIHPQHLLDRVESAYLAQSRVAILDAAALTSHGDARALTPSASSVIDNCDDRSPSDASSDDIDHAVVDVLAEDADDDWFWKEHLPSPANQSRHHTPKNFCADIVDAAEEAETAWTDLAECDNLLRLMEANDIFCGFKEPPITFLPSHPRSIGVAAAYNPKAVEDLPNLFTLTDHVAPSYVDRILHHSMPGVTDRFTNVSYGICEDVVSSNHKPICGSYRLEVNRLDGFTHRRHHRLSSSSPLGMRHPAMEPTVPAMRQFRIDLHNLDVNLWQPSSQVRVPSVQSYSMCMTTRRSFCKEPCTCRPLSTPAKVSHRFQMMHNGTLIPFPTFARPNDVKCAACVADEVDSDDMLGIHAADPIKISIIFPIPVMDGLMQRQVPHHPPTMLRHDGEHPSFACTRGNRLHPARRRPLPPKSSAFTTEVAWTEAQARGLSHTAVSHVSPLYHIVVKIDGSRGDGGQGVLAISEADLSTTRQFDIPLTWGSKHAGYLHVDVTATIVSDVQWQLNRPDSVPQVGHAK